MRGTSLLNQKRPSGHLNQAGGGGGGGDKCSDFFHILSEYGPKWGDHDNVFWAPETASSYEKTRF